MSLFSRFFAPKTPNATPGAEESSPSGYDDLAKKVPFAGDPTGAERPASTTTYDSLADEVPFAGDPRMRRALQESETAPTAPTETSESAETAEKEVPPEVRAFRDFLKTDLRIKRELIDLAPSERDLADEESAMGYVDGAYKAFRGLRRDFARLENAFSDDPASPKLMTPTEEFFSQGEQAFALSHYDAVSVKKLYNDKFAQMRPDFVEQVKDKSCGYVLFDSPTSLYGQAASVNELLHAHHAAVLNNEQILQSIPEVDTKKICDGHYDVALRGEDTELGRDIFGAFPEDFDAGSTDIVAIDNQVLMMVRDRGHALTIDIDYDPSRPDEVWVQYHIPKICNTLMIEELPGVGKITPAGADGRFAAPREAFGAKLVDFIGHVPTDADMDKPGGLGYRGEAE